MTSSARTSLSLAIAGIAILSLAEQASASTAGTAVCAAETLLLRNTVILDASGRWDDQDILIEDGEISAIGSDLDVDSVADIHEIDATGAIVRPRQSETIQLFVRTSTAPRRETSAAYIMPGTAADLTVFSGEAADAPVALDIRGGHIQGGEDICAPGQVFRG